MSSKTRIVVLHMKEIVYTILFAVFIIGLFLLLFFMFFPKTRETGGSIAAYHPGVYTSAFTVGNTDLTVEVTVTESEISSVRFSDLDDTVTAMYPLIQPAMEEIADQVTARQTLEGIELSADTPYTSQIIITAIDDALKKATVN